MRKKYFKTNPAQVNNDDRDFYGHNYWFSHQEKDLGFPNILDRAQSDLAGRCLHWLKTLLNYKLPPGKALELGSAHGGFVALLQWAGFDATGLELSPWVAEKAQKMFGIETLVGPVENQDIEPDSLDIIAMMDVLEHLPDPIGTLRQCLGLLKNNGIFYIQTPLFPESKSYADLVEQNDPFLDQFKAAEHLYLFSKSAISKIFSEMRCDYIQFVPTVFPQYDMSIIASRTHLTKNSPDKIQKSLISSPKGRLIITLLLLANQVKELTRLLKESEIDRNNRLDQIKDLGAKHKESEADRSARLAQIKELTRLLKNSEKDRNNRLDQIKDLGAKHKESEADRSARLAQIKELTRLLKDSEKDRNNRLDQIKDLGAKHKESEADRSARLAQIKELTRLLKDSEKDRNNRLDQITELSKMLKTSEIAYLEGKRKFEALEKKAQNFKNRIASETQRALKAAEGWKNLEETFTVRGARKIGLIKVQRFDSSQLKKKQNVKKSD